MSLGSRLQAALKAFNNDGWTIYGGGMSPQPGVPITGLGFDSLMAANVQHVARCIDLLTTVCAQTPLRLYAKTKTSGPKRLNFPHRTVTKRQKDFMIANIKGWSDAGDIEEITKHPVLDVLANVNGGNDNPMDLYSYIISQHGLVGNGFVVKERKGGQVIGLNTSDPARWSIVPGKDGRIERYVFQKGAQKIEYAPEDVLHFKNPDPRSTFMGTGVLARHLDSYNTDLSIRTHALNTFRKGSSLDLWFNADKDLEISKDEQKAFTNILRQIFGGTRGERIGFGQAINVQQIGQTLKDLEYSQGRKIVRDEIYSAFNVPIYYAELSGSSLGSGATGQAAEMIFARLGIKPRLRMMEEEFNADLVPEFDTNLLLMFDSPMPNDRQQDRDDVAIYVDRGILTRNEVREQKLGLPPVEFEETFPGERGSGSVFGSFGSGSDTGSEPGASGSGDGTDPVKRVKQDRKAIRQAHWKAFDRRLRKHEQAITRKARALLGEMWGEMLGRMGEKSLKTGDKVDQWLFDKEKWQEKFIEGLYPPIEATFLSGANAHGVLSFDLNSPRAEAILHDALNRVKTIPAERWGLISESLEEGIHEGETLSALRDRVREFQDEDDKYGAERIARTEAGGAYNGGHFEAIMQDEDSAGLEWVATNDDRTRDSHAAVDGEKRAKGERFSNGLLYPGEAGAAAEEVINCRCTVMSVERGEL